MIIKTENFHMDLWDWDWPCLWQVQSNPDVDNSYFWEVMNNEDFLLEVWHLAVRLAEDYLKEWKLTINNNWKWI